MDQYRIFDRDGIFIGQLRTAAERAWTLVSETSARFPLSIYDPKCNKNLLNYGHWLLAENSDGLPPWVGMIDRRSFDRGLGIFTAYTPERAFLYKRGPRRQTLTGKAGEIFAQMIQYINGLEKTVLQVGDINSSTNIMQETINPVPLINNLRRIVERSGEGYRWRPQVTKNTLTIYADWFSNLVLDTGLVLSDGFNLALNHPFDELPPVNDQLAYGIGTDWEKRPMVSEIDSESIEDYGLRQASTSLNTPNVDVLRVAAKTLLSGSKQPKGVFPLTVINKAGTFAKLEPGVLAVFTQLVGSGFSDNEIGYKNYERIIRTMGYNPLNGVVPIALF